MDSNKKKNSVRYKCQVRDINKKACLTRASTLTFVLSRKLLEAVAARAAPFLMQLSRQLCCRFASAKTQMQVKRVLNGRCASVQRGGGTSACCPAHSAVQHAN